MSCNVTRNMRQSGVEIRFTTSPSAETTQQLKSKGFRWSFRQRVWYVRYTESLHQWAIDLCGDTEHSDNPAEVVLQNFADQGRNARHITLAVLTSQGKVPQGILREEIKGRKLEMARYKQRNAMYDSTDYIPDNELVWEDASLESKEYDIEQLRKGYVNTHWTNSITINDDGTIQLGGLKFRYKTDVIGHDYNPGLERQKIKDLEAQAAAAKKQAAAAKLDLAWDNYHVPRNRPARIGTFKIETPLSPDDFVDAEPFRAVMEKDGYRLTGLLTAKNMVTSTTRVLFGNAPAVENRENVWQFKADSATPSYVSRYDKFRKEEEGDTSDFPEWPSPTYPYYLWQGMLQAARDAKYEREKMSAATNPRGKKIHEGRLDEALKRLAIQKRQWINYESKNPAPLRLVTGEGPAEQTYRTLLWQRDLYAMKLAEKDVNSADVEAARLNAEAELRGETVAAKPEPAEAPKDPNHIEGFNYDVPHDLEGFKYVRRFKQDNRDSLSARQVAYLGEVETGIARKLQNEGVNAYEAAFVEKAIGKKTETAPKYDPQSGEVILEEYPGQAMQWPELNSLSNIQLYFPNVQFSKFGDFVSNKEVKFAETASMEWFVRDLGESETDRWALVQRRKSDKQKGERRFSSLSDATFQAEKAFDRHSKMDDVILSPYLEGKMKENLEAWQKGSATTFKGENLKMAERKENLPEPKFKKGDRAKYRGVVVTVMSEGRYDPGAKYNSYSVQADNWAEPDDVAEPTLQPYKEVPQDKKNYQPATERTMPFGTGANQAKKLEELKAAKYKTASQETLIELMERRLNADPSKWQPGDGVGIKLGVKKVSSGGQVNRGYAIIYVDAPTKTALVAAVADTGLASSDDYVSPQETARYIGRMKWEPIGDLIRDRDYDLNEKGIERYQQKAVYAGLLVEAEDKPDVQTTKTAETALPTEETDSETYGAIRLNAHDRPFFSSPMMVGEKPNFTKNFHLAGMVPQKYFEQTIADLPFKAELLEFVTTEQWKRERDEAESGESAEIVKPASEPANSKLQTARTSLKLLQKALPRLEGARKKTAETEIKLLTRFIEKNTD